MKALVYHGPGKKPWEVKPKPAIMDPTDALLKIQMRDRFTYNEGRCPYRYQRASTRA
jgi:hypothetical protein